MIGGSASAFCRRIKEYPGKRLITAQIAHFGASAAGRRRRRPRTTIVLSAPISTGPCSSVAGFFATTLWEADDVALAGDDAPVCAKTGPAAIKDAPRMATFPKILPSTKYLDRITTSLSPGTTDLSEDSFGETIHPLRAL
ncbi:hypothetical protein [Sphingomonas sp.]|uniref:hypothetical protein n=1 Tax=Sphingomonas sp. TaxID=28214 RepID=UPI0031DB978A